MVTIYGTPFCNYCQLAKDLCDEENIDYLYIDMFENETAVEDVTAYIGPFKTVPQIFVDGEYIGGYTEFHAYTAFNP